MSSLKLITPSVVYLNSYLEACREYKEGLPNPYITHDPDKFDEWKDIIFVDYENEKKGRGLKPGYVASSTFWLVDGCEYIGTGNIRHSLTEALSRFGGNIGYVIRCSRRGEGCGTELLRLLLIEAGGLGINPALVTCDITNIASAKVMEKNGARLADIIENIIDGRPRMTCRYWIDTVHASNCLTGNPDT